MAQRGVFAQRKGKLLRCDGLHCLTGVIWPELSAVSLLIPTNATSYMETSQCVSGLEVSGRSLWMQPMGSRA